MGAVLGGCWSNNGSNGSPDGGIPDLAGPVCNSLPFADTFVQPMDSGNPTPPAATGGALAGGSYHLTASSYYPLAVCAVDPIASRLVVSSSSATTGTMQTATLTSAGHYLNESTAYLINDTSLVVRIECLAPDPAGALGSAAQIEYNATPTEVQLYGNGGCGNRVDTYDLD